MTFRDYVGKGNPLVYWYNSGKHFGFPDCCIQAFLDEDLPDESLLMGQATALTESVLSYPMKKLSKVLTLGVNTLNLSLIVTVLWNIIRNKCMGLEI